MIRDAKAVVFDFDGTLVDASEAICRAFGTVVREKDGPDLADDAIRPMIGRPLRDMFLSVFPTASSEEIEDCVDGYREHFMPLSRSLSRPIAGLLEVIPRLAVHLRLAIATSRSARGATHILDEYKLRQYFPVVIGIYEVSQFKPHPEPVLCALAELGVEPGNGVMVGDTADDIVAGRAAGVTTVGMASDTAKADQLRGEGADYVIRDLYELEGLIESPREG